jgi:hypothetical protein
MSIVETDRELRVPHRIHDGAVHFDRVMLGIGSPPMRRSSGRPEVERRCR